MIVAVQWPYNRAWAPSCSTVKLHSCRHMACARQLLHALVSDSFKRVDDQSFPLLRVFRCRPCFMRRLLDFAIGVCSPFFVPSTRYTWLIRACRFGDLLCKSDLLIRCVRFSEFKNCMFRPALVMAHRVWGGPMRA